MIGMAFQIFWASVKEFILPYGTGGLIIAVCIGLYFFTDMLGVTVAALLKPFRTDMIWIAAVTAGLMVFMSYVIHLERKACDARQVVITNTVHKAVGKARAPASLKTPDPFDSPEN
jgi:hypothetical protein